MMYCKVINEHGRHTNVVYVVAIVGKKRKNLEKGFSKEKKKEKKNFLDLGRVLAF